MAVHLRLVQFESEGKQRVGVELEDGKRVVDITAIDSTIPADMKGFLELWDSNATKATQAVEAALSSCQHILNPGHFILKAPIYNPQKVIGVGLNYANLCTELNIPRPDEPILFSKFSSAITGPNCGVILPAETKCLGYEAELAFVISKTGKHIKESDAMSHVAGYTVANDVTAHDWQMHKNGGQWLVGKTFDTFCPLGPALVTRAAISDPHKLGIHCQVNGEPVQSSNTDQLIYKTEALVAFISQFMTLQPGDIILTGTPPGVAPFRKPPLWLKKGDVVECDIDEIGKITNIIE